MSTLKIQAKDPLNERILLTLSTPLLERLKKHSRDFGMSSNEFIRTVLHMCMRDIELTEELGVCVVCKKTDCVCVVREYGTRLG